MNAQFQANKIIADILVVEDDDIDAKEITRSFDKVGISSRIYRAWDGVEALELLRGENGKNKINNSCLLVIDINMPRMNGIKLIQEVRNDPGLKRSIIFVLTTSSHFEDKAACYDLNVAAYIVKGSSEASSRALADLVKRYLGVVVFP